MSISDNGDDDDTVMFFEPFPKKDKKKLRMPVYTLDEDIIATMKSE